eukprot:CAMPEP_0115063748 /NCGR_PEP_ID=MMETSP0227-20121206/9281_1 /TAXON_ID=89957 /ORGANISM="Polarella glacialis, Strain CCMP 1383" /LENGTH=112 /DNA_ID=CAMNT_0002449287 /DNA_START=154 /DNA_END=493 /DNA_ORIENTATION=+
MSDYNTIGASVPSDSAGTRSSCLFMVAWQSRMQASTDGSRGLSKSSSHVALGQSSCRCSWLSRGRSWKPDFVPTFEEEADVVVAEADAQRPSGPGGGQARPGSSEPAGPASS